MAQPAAAEVTFDHPGVEEWLGADGAFAHFGRVDITDMIQFSRANNQSGFRQAVGYLSEQTGVKLPSSDNGEGRPVILVASQNGSVEFYDGRQGRGRWSGVRQGTDSHYEVLSSERLDKNTVVTFDEGDAVYFGVVSRRAGDGPGTPDLPFYELFRRVSQATDRRRRSLLGRFAQVS